VGGTPDADQGWVWMGGITAKERGLAPLEATWTLAFLLEIPKPSVFSLPGVQALWIARAFSTESSESSQYR